MRIRYEVIGDNEVIMHDPAGRTGQEGAWTFWAPSGGGYVRSTSDSKPGTLGQQVCERLACHGSTLWWTPASGPLVNLIRHEARRAAADWKRISA